MTILAAYSDGLNIVKQPEHELTAIGRVIHNERMAAPKSQIQQIAERLRMAREALGMKPAELCRVTGIRPNTYSQWESGLGQPSLSEALKLCRTLSYTLDWIYRADPSGLPHRIASKLPGREPRHV